MKNEHGKIAIPRAVLDGILAVRASGLTNMFDWCAATEIAAELGHAEAARWIPDNLGRYAAGIIHGFVHYDEPAAAAEIAPGRVMRYVGAAHPALTGLTVRVVGRIGRRRWEFAPWVAEERRYSWITSDAREDELAPLEPERKP
ncbi:MAG: DUF5049 domain-containing protein [Deltaproteobacteria bacterium]|nr:DUF5049 domain-containing protein [Deltaproteobacteria bacterium]